MSKSAPLTFIVGFAVLVYESSSFPYTDILANDAYPKINDKIAINESNNSFLMEPNCLPTESTFCENLASYPAEKIKQLLTPDFNNYFQQYPIGLADRNQIENVQSDGMCAISQGFLKPVVGITANNISMLIINMGLNYTQEIRIEKCMESATCSNVKAKENYRSYCKQKYTYQRLLSVDYKFEKISLQLFKVPSGCCCAAKLIS